jgi:hypothetical protein
MQSCTVYHLLPHSGRSITHQAISLQPIAESLAGLALEHDVSRRTPGRCPKTSRSMMKTALRATPRCQEPRRFAPRPRETQHGLCDCFRDDPRIVAIASTASKLFAAVGPSATPHCPRFSRSRRSRRFSRSRIWRRISFPRPGRCRKASPWTMKSKASETTERQKHYRAQNHTTGKGARKALPFSLRNSTYMCLALASISHIADAQIAATLQSGVRVRIVPVNGKRIVGTVASATTDSVSLYSRGTRGSTLTFARSEVSTIQVSRGRSRVQGALIKGAIGLGIGAVSGALIGATTYSRDENTCTPSAGNWCLFGCLIVCSRGDAALFAGTLLGAGGLLVGTVTGVATGWEKWDTVEGRTR